MGTWDTGIYQNDLGADVRDDYIAKLKAGKSDEEALQEILSEYKEESEDDDEKYDFYPALADTLWKKGRLTEEIKEKALEILEEDKISGRWEGEKIRKERIKVLDKLKEKLESPMPERKKVPIHKPYKLGWEEGQVYYFQIKGNVPKLIKGYEEYVGWHAMFYVDKIYTKDWQVKGVQDELAELFFFLQKEKPESVEDILSATKVCFDIGLKNSYKIYLCEDSKRSRPKDLFLLGKIDNFSYPNNCNPVSRFFGWGCAERDILWGYVDQIKYEQEKNNIV